MLRTLVAALIVPPFLPAALAETYLAAPFANRSTDAKMDWIGESISEAIREAAAFAGVDITTREERDEAHKKLSLRGTPQLSLASVVKLAEAANADRVVHGQFEVMPASATEKPPSRGSLRITARIWDAKKLAQVAEESETGAIEDLPGLQANLAWSLLRSMGSRREIKREDLLRQHRAVKVNALENYVRGLMSTSRWFQHRYFTQAARLDPGFPHPNFQLGRLQWNDEHYREAIPWLEKVPADFPHYREAMFMLAVAKHEISDFNGAARQLEAIVPTLPAPEVWNNLGAAQSRLGRPEAVQSFRRAFEADPNDTDYQFNLGYALWRQRDYAGAADRFRAVLDRSPDDQDAIQILGRCLASTGPRPGDVRAEGLERLKDGYTEPASK